MHYRRGPKVKQQWMIHTSLVGIKTFRPIKPRGCLKMENAQLGKHSILQSNDKPVEFRGLTFRDENPI